jgi:glycosyltransferase involved in cell wall biosynthesis
MKNILIDAERTNYIHTGLYHFCRHLINSIALHNRTDEYNLSTYAPERERGLFNKDISVVAQYSLHKFYQPFLTKFQLFHSTFQGTNYFPFCIKGKVLLTVHDLNFLHEDTPLAKRKKYLANLEKKLARADSVVAISEYVKRDILQHTSVAPEKVQVIYNGCNIRPEADAGKPACLPKKPFFFTIGAITDKKNFHVLPAMLLKNDFDLIIAGLNQKPEYKMKIEAAAKELGVQDRVHIIGVVSEAEKVWYLQNCEAFAFPSIAEGFGLPVIEAMHFGKPVILSTCTSLPEIGGKEAYYFENFDPEHISHKTMEVLEDNLKNNRSEAIIQWAGRFSWDTTACRYLQEYDRLLA